MSAELCIIIYPKTNMYTHVCLRDILNMQPLNKLWRNMYRKNAQVPMSKYNYENKTKKDIS